MKRVNLGRRTVYLTHHWRYLYIAKSRHFWASFRRYPGCTVIVLLGFELAITAKDGGRP